MFNEGQNKKDIDDQFNFHEPSDEFIQKRLVYSYLYGAVLRSGNKGSNFWCDMLESDDSVMYSIISKIDYDEIKDKIQYHILSLKTLDNIVTFGKRHISAILTLVADYITLLMHWNEKLSDDSPLKNTILSFFSNDVKHIKDLFYMIDSKLLNEIDGATYFTSIFFKAKKLNDWSDSPNTDFNANVSDNVSINGYMFDVFRNICESIVANFALIKSIANRDFNTVLYNRNHNPHVTLMIAFFELLKNIDSKIIDFKYRHLKYYYEGVLMFKKRKSMMDNTIICLSCNSFSSNTFLPRKTNLSGGKDRNGNDIIFKTNDGIMVGHAAIKTIKTFLRSGIRLSKFSNNPGIDVEIAAYDMDEVYSNNSKLYLFSQKRSNATTLKASKGINKSCLLIYSPVLKLKDGQRKISICIFPLATSLKLLLQEISKIYYKNLEKKHDHVLKSFSRLLEKTIAIYYSCDEEIIKIPSKNTNCFWNSERQCFSIDINVQVGMPPVSESNIDNPINIKKEKSPIISITLNNTEMLWCWILFCKIQYEKICINVDVKECRDLILQNDLGLIDCGQSFFPFGPMPNIGSNFYIGSNEIFSKNISNLRINIEWGNLPNDKGFKEYYKDYGEYVDTHDFVASVSFLHQRCWFPLNSESRQIIELFDSTKNTNSDEIILEDKHINNLNLQLLNLDGKHNFEQQSFFSSASTGGFLRFELCGPPMAFGHYIYPQLLAKSMFLEKVKYIKKLVKKDIQTPYTPTIKTISLDYSSNEEINLLKKKMNSNDFVYVHPFGYQSLIVEKNDKRESVFIDTLSLRKNGYALINIEIQNLDTPTFNLYIDIDQVSVDKQNTCVWKYLSDNQWIPFSKEYIIGDETNNLMRSGIIKFRVPKINRKNNTICKDTSDNSTWIQLMILSYKEKLPTILNIYLQVVRATRGEDTGEYKIESNSIKSTFDSSFSNINIFQPLSSVGGRQEETEQQLYTRISQRLRHKDRAISTRDYEDIVLSSFPQISSVKCIKKNKNHIIVVVLDRSNSVNNGRIFPETSKSTLNSIREELFKHCSPFVKIDVINPVYEKFKIVVEVKFKDDDNTEIYKKELNNAIKMFLSPWRFDINDTQNIKIGNSIRSIDIITFIKSLDYVKVVGNFIIMKKNENKTVCVTNYGSVLHPSHEWSILYSSNQHDIIAIDKLTNTKDNGINIGNMRVGENFVVGPLDIEKLEQKESKQNLLFNESIEGFYLSINNTYVNKEKK